MLTTRAGIVIVTRNRPELLLACIESIVCQLTANDTIYIIDNDSDIKYLFKFKRLKNIYLESNSIAKARNIGFNLCKQENKDLCVYIDDDCLASNNWLRQIKRIHVANKHAAAVSGRITNSETDNIYGTIHNGLSRAWMLKSNSVDTKNVSIKVRLIKTSHPFDDKRDIYKREDTLFSDYLHMNNLEIIQSERIVVSHQEKDSLLEYLKKRIAIANSSKKTKARLVNEDYKRKYELSVLEELPIIAKLIISEIEGLRFVNVLKIIALCMLMVLVKMNAKLSLYKK